MTPLCSDGKEDSLFIRNRETMDVLKKKDGKLETLQLHAVAYLWEICYDLLLANGENVSASRGFESLGLRVTRKRRKLNDN